MIFKQYLIHTCKLKLRQRKAISSGALKILATAAREVLYFVYNAILHIQEVLQYE